MPYRCKVVHPNLAGGYFLKGYLKECTLTDQEWFLLRTCIAARYKFNMEILITNFQIRWAQSLVIGAWTYKQDPSNEYVLVTARGGGWNILASLWKESDDEMLVSAWKDIVNS